ncbi:hypothetical protein J6590_046673 [Homalodisca vitripennis]|nr:hypothetical protein J6590_046673 [Homalodisca vitripennis]
MSVLPKFLVSLLPHWHGSGAATHAQPRQIIEWPVASETIAAATLTCVYATVPGRNCDFTDRKEAVAARG